MDLHSLLFLISYFLFLFVIALVIVAAFKKVKKRIKRERQIDEILDHLTNQNKRL